MITLTINGKEKTIAETMSVARFLVESGIDPRIVAVELNGRILRRDQLAEVTLGENDVVEIVRMIGGG